MIKRPILTTAIFITIIFTISAISYFLTTSTTGRSFKDSIQPFFENELKSGSGTYIILLLTISLFLAQCFSGYSYNRSKLVLTKPGKKRVDILVHYMATRVFLLTYSLYELSAFFMLNTMIFSLMLSHIETSVTVGLTLLKVIILTLLVTLGVGLLFKLIIIELLFKRMRPKLYKWKIKEETIEGKIVSDLQKQICNASFILILVLTYLGIHDINIDKSETALFFGLATFILAAYSYMIAKSKMFKFLIPLRG